MVASPSPAPAPRKEFAPALGTWLRAWLEKKKQKILLSKKKTDAHMHQGERLTPCGFLTAPCQKGAVRKPHDLDHPTRLLFAQTPSPPAPLPRPALVSLDLSSSLPLSQLDSQTASRRPPQPPRSRGASATAPAAPRDGLTASAAPGAPPLRGAWGQNLARRISLTLPDFEPFRATGRRRSRAAEARRDVRIKAWK